MTRENRGPEARGLNEKAQYRSQWGLKMGWILGQVKIITVQVLTAALAERTNSRQH